MIQPTKQEAVLTTLVLLVCGMLFFPNTACAQGHTYGFDIANNDYGPSKNPTTPEDGHKGVTATDFYKLLDNSIGNHFGGLILVFGGCYTGDFTNQAANSVIAQKPVAILAATSKDDRHEQTADIDGENPFLTGVAGTWAAPDLLGNGGTKYGTAKEAFEAGKGDLTTAVTKYNTDNKLAINDKTVKAAKGSNPSFTAFPAGDNSAGSSLTLQGSGKGEKYAIIFMGKPTTYYDWNAVHAQYQAFIDSGYPADHIQVFFGTGRRADPGSEFAGSPLLTNDNGGPGISVNEEAAKRAEGRNGLKPSVEVNYTNAQGKPEGIPFQAATFAHFKSALLAWKTFAKDDKNGDNQYVVVIGTHSTSMAHPREASDLEFAQALSPNSPNGSYYVGAPTPEQESSEAIASSNGEEEAFVPDPVPSNVVAASFPPPALPLYDQPLCPAPGYMWVPGYWGFGKGVYFWVPGTWVPAPAVGLLWTPGYWGFAGGLYVWHEGYWGTHVGFYGGINYGFGYTGSGYDGGIWHDGVFRYNVAVSHVDSSTVETYAERAVTSTTSNNRSSYNGEGGVETEPSTSDKLAAQEPHLPPTTEQTHMETLASANRSLSASENHGYPSLSATAKPDNLAATETYAASHVGSNAEGFMPSATTHTATTHTSPGITRTTENGKVVTTTMKTQSQPHTNSRR